MGRAKAGGTKLIVGLGNPGASYRHNRHNAGACAVEKLAHQKRLPLRPHRFFKSFLASGRIKGRPVILALPQTFMNLSGEAVAALIRKKKISLLDLLIVCDDVAFPLGVLRVKSKGSDGGHNGLASVIEQIGSRDVARLRIGIGPGAAGADLSDFVLSDFSKEEEPLVKRALEQAAEAMEAWVVEGIDKCMSRFNTKQQKGVNQV